MMESESYDYESEVFFPLWDKYNFYWKGKELSGITWNVRGGLVTV